MCGPVKDKQIKIKAQSTMSVDTRAEHCMNNNEKNVVNVKHCQVQGAINDKVQTDTFHSFTAEKRT